MGRVKLSDKFVRITGSMSRKSSGGAP
jgi:hypothetical protein